MNPLVREPDLPTTEREPRRAGQRTGVRVLLGLVAAGAIGVVFAAGRAAVRPAGAGDRLGAGAAVTRDGRRLAPIERVVRARGQGRLPLYLAPARGPVIDSARVGVLAARLVSGTESGTAPQIALVPRDAVAGLVLVARLVVTPGEPGLLVFGASRRTP